MIRIYNLKVQTPGVAPTEDTQDVAVACTTCTNNENKWVHTTMLPKTAVNIVKDYALRLNNNTSAQWEIQPSENIVLDDDTIEMETLVKVLDNPANGTYQIGSFAYMGKYISSSDNFIPVPILSSEQPLPECVTAVTNPAVSPNPETTSLSRESVCTTISDAAPLRVPLSETLELGKNGSISFKLTELTKENNNKIGFIIDGKQYAFVILNNKIYLEYSSQLYGPYSTATTGIVCSLERNNGLMKYKIGTRLLYASVSSNVASIFLDLGKPGNTISQVSLSRQGSITYNVANELNLSMIKSNEGYTPQAHLTQYRQNTITNEIIKHETTIAGGLTSVLNAQKGITLNYNHQGHLNYDYLYVNGAGTQKALVWQNEVAATAMPAITTQGQATLGSTQGNTLPMDMCYYNYKIKSLNYNNDISHRFSFNDETNSNPQEESQQTSMQVSPSANRQLGPCLADSDGDGIYDLYEIDSNGFALDTDGDGIANHLDPDDDGDGILTKYENADPNNDHNPIDALNSNSEANVNNPNLIINTLPDYLDVDDDGDGYATWETTEGGMGYPNPSAGTAYTLDDDNNGIVNYLDPASIVYPATKAMFNKNYVNLVGDKRFELSNHLGNVLVVINDKKIADNSTTVTQFNPDVLSFSDYYPFGQLVPNRHGSSDSYRYGFNGKEKDDELKGEGNSYDFGSRMLDPRVGRWFTKDPLFKIHPEISTYAYVLNNPIYFIDPDGEREFPSYQAYVRALGKNALSYEKMGSQGHWTAADRFTYSKVWNNANEANLKKLDGYKEYNRIGERADFYGWFQMKTEKAGYGTKWAGAAYVIAKQMELSDLPIPSLFLSEDVKNFAEAGNIAIFNNVFPKLQSLLLNGKITGIKAKAWDAKTLTTEQRDVVGPIYKRQTLETLKTLENMAKQKGLFSLGSESELKFEGNINLWQDRFKHGMEKAVPFWDKIKDNPDMQGGASTPDHNKTNED